MSNLPWIVLIFLAGLNSGLNLSILYPASPTFHASWWKIVFSIAIVIFASSMFVYECGIKRNKG